MAERVQRALDEKSVDVIEAGTGTGKTFAYLVPLVASDGKYVVSTGTKNLQEQLFHRDLPAVLGALNKGKKAALLKGRSNYLCTTRLNLHLTEAEQLVDPQALDDLVKVKRWANRTNTGDIGELAELQENSRVLPYVTSTTDNCLGRECADFESCYLHRARQEAMDADVVVINHHLFFADMALKDTGFGELIPQTDGVIFDEAHQLPDIATAYFGESLSTRQMTDLCKDAELAYHAEAKDQKQLPKAAKKLKQSLQDFRLCFGRDPERGNWRLKSRSDDVIAALSHLESSLSFLKDVLKICLGRGEQCDQCFERVVHFLGLLKLLCNVEKEGMSFWYETTARHAILHATPLDVAERFGSYVEQQESAWVFTSATLKVGDGFEHFCAQLGINAAGYQLQSPFDYQKQGLLYVPRELPEPVGGQPSAQQFVASCLPLIKAAQGGVFLLFTSYRMMHQVAEVIGVHIENPVLVQGQSSKRLLLEQFKQHGRSVLLATGSFWEGVDVRGDALCCVIIDKLPFAAPDDPLIAARVEDCQKRGLDGFATVQLPQAVISLKQGAGRLIRDISDYGVLAIFDSRLVSKPYGYTFLSSLPDMPRTRTLDKAIGFLKKPHS